jgi:tetratricopeptide (TPR) repeat protein
MKFPPRRALISTLLSIGILLILVVPAMAQNRAIRGLVTDEKDQPVVDAKITVQATDLYRVFSDKTKKNGTYMFLLGLQPATYRVIVRKAGYKPQYQQNIRPELQEEKEVNFKLVPGQDFKLPFEMSEQEKEQNKKLFDEQKERAKYSAEVKAHFDLGVKLFEEGKYAEAMESFNKALEKNPKQPGIVSRVADCYMNLEKNEEALANYDKAIEMNTPDANVYMNRGVVLSKLGKIAESQEAFKKAAEMDPSSAAKNFYNLGLTMINSGNNDKAVEALKQAIAADAGYAEAYYQLGMVLSGVQDTIPAAIEALKKYLEIGQKEDQKQIAKEIISTLEKK